MTEIYLAKTILNEKDFLIFTNGKRFSKVKDSFLNVNNLTDFLSLDANRINFQEKDLEFKIPGDIKYLDLIEDQHIFATGCTYKWSKEQLESTPDNDVYKMLYLSERSMFFYKGNKSNCANNFSPIGIRKDAEITIPEAEMVAVFNNSGEIVGYTLGNDVTALDIEKQNPLFQAQAKFYKGSVALLPMIKLGKQLPKTSLKCKVLREGKSLVETNYHTSNFNRVSGQIVKQLMTSQLNPNGGFLFLGCGIPYPQEFGLVKDDIVTIEADNFPISLQNKCVQIG